MAALGRSMLFAVLVSLFLSIVGAFGTIGVPLVPRTLFFFIIGAGGGLIVALCIALSDRLRSLDDRPLLRRTVIGLAVTPLMAVWVWLVIGYTLLGGPKMASLPKFLAYSLFMSALMSVLSWAMFRSRQSHDQSHGQPQDKSSTDAPPKFLQRLPVRLRGAEIYAVEAQDHYLKLHTSKGSDLILMRLSDAVAELDGLEGAQTHRSWWVAKSALADARRGDGRAVLKLKDGGEAPVSRRYTRALRQAGWF